MKFLQKLNNLLFGASDKHINNVVEENIIHKPIDKVSNFNKLAPELFGPRLKEYGYVFSKMENSEDNGFLYSTHHFYKNEILNLTVDIQQAPYYTEYGFSIFLLSSEKEDSLLLCNVPHELQDNEDNFLISISNKFFTNPDVISMLKGESWKIINHIRID